MTSICILASGSKGNAIYVSNDRTAILLDAGLSGIEIERRLHSRGINPDSLDAIVVSHEHTDHIHGVGVLSRRFHVPVYVNEPTLAAAREQLGSLYETRRFQRGSAFSIGSLCMHPFTVSHDAAEPVGFTIQDGRAKIGIATDLGVATQLVRYHLMGCTMVVLEANHDLKMLEEGPYPWAVKQRIRSRHGHLSNEASRDLLGEICHSELRHVVLAHVSETNNHPEKVISVIKESAPDHLTSLTVAAQHEPGDVICLENS